MSYEVLARRWRPQTFDEVSGQRHVTTALTNAIRLGKLPHALLLAGPRGVGKTTLARILARALNCDEGPTEKPCGKCSSCTEIAAGTSLDVQEIDAASNTGVDNVRELRESIRYAAAPGKHRIYVIDEVHMLSSAAFNALLKTLEEPPPNSLFVFATTDPQKIPATVLSRVQRFDLKRLGPGETLARLREIVKAEEIEIPESVLRALVREGDGSLRDALTLLDRLGSALGNKIEEDAAIAILDLIDRRILVDILDPVLAQDPANALVAVRRAIDKGIEPARLASDLLASLRDLLVARLVPEPGELIDLSPDELGELQARAKPHDPETLQRLFRVLLARNQELAWTTRPEHALEMAVVRLATLPDAEALGALVQKLERLEGDGGGPGGPGPAGPGAAGPGSGPKRGKGAQGRPSPRPRRSDGPRAAAVAPPKQPSAPPVAATAAPPAPVAQAPKAPLAVVPEAPRASAPAPLASEPPPAATEEPPPPSDADFAASPRESEPEPVRAESAPAAPKPGRDPKLEARLRREAKDDPAVKRVIEALDAELREVRVPRSALKRAVNGDAS